MTEKELRVRMPKTVRIDDHYMIRVDDYGYSLINNSTSRSRNPKHDSSAEVVRVVGYYYTVADALKDYVRRSEREYLSESDTATFEDLLNKLTEMEKRVENACFRGILEGLKTQMEKDNADADS